MTSSAACGQLAPHAVAVLHYAEQQREIEPELTVGLLTRLAQYARSRGAFSTAEPLCQRALAISEKALGPEHAETAASLYYLAMIYYSQGRAQEAEPLCQRALAIRQKALGPDHPSIALLKLSIELMDKLAGGSSEKPRQHKERS